MDSNEIKGTGKDMLGKLKDGAGGLTGDVGLQAEGKVDQLSGKAQKQFGNVADQVKEGVESATDQATGLADRATAKVSEFTDAAAKSFGQASGKASEAVSNVSSQATDFTHRANDYVGQAAQRQPLLTLIGIGAIGYLIAFLVHSPTSPITARHGNRRSR